MKASHGWERGRTGEAVGAFYFRMTVTEDPLALTVLFSALTLMNYKFTLEIKYLMSYLLLLPLIEL